MTDARKNWIASDRFIPTKFVRPALRLTRISAASGIVLVAAAVLAMLWANLPVFGDTYLNFWQETDLKLSIGPVHFEESLKDLVNDGLMTVFFFVMGLEIKRALVMGELRDPRKAVLPVVAALGGMVLPALIFAGFNSGDPALLRGWGIPMATDIAFSLGILTLLGTRAPVGTRLFLLAVAIVDDIGALLVIAIFYTAELHFGYLALGLGALAVCGAATKANIRSHLFYLPLAVVAWYGFLESGVHATIAGVILAFIVPARPLYEANEFDRAAQRTIERLRDIERLTIPPKGVDPAVWLQTIERLRSIEQVFPPEDPSFQEKVEHQARLMTDIARESIAPLSRLEHLLYNWSAFLILPIFALANAGVRLAGIDPVEAASSSITLGVIAGLVAGKSIGVAGFSWLVVKLRLARLPSGVGWRHMTGTAMLAGVGFTVALFIAELAYVHAVQPISSPLDLAKIGVFVGSILAGVLGYVILRTAPSGRSSAPQDVSTD